MYVCCVCVCLCVRSCFHLIYRLVVPLNLNCHCKHAQEHTCSSARSYHHRSARQKATTSLRPHSMNERALSSPLGPLSLSVRVACVCGMLLITPDARFWYTLYITTLYILYMKCMKYQVLQLHQLCDSSGGLEMKGTCIAYSSGCVSVLVMSDNLHLCVCACVCVYLTP